MKKTNDKNIVYTADALIFDSDNIVLIKRKYPPFEGLYALPGGHVDNSESAEDACIREVKEETSLKVKILKKIGVFDKKGRDPRGNYSTTAFICEVLNGNFDQLKSGDDALTAELLPIEKVKGMKLAFDHNEILKKALKKR